jgi:hypothetical protein
MSDVNLPAYAKIPNGPHEPNVTPPGVVIVENSYKMTKNLMKITKPQVKMKSTHRSPPKKKDSVKWY